MLRQEGGPFEEDTYDDNPGDDLDLGDDLVGNGEVDAA